jgi:hypothetical protein
VGIEPQQTSSVDSPCSPIYADDFVRREGEDFRIPDDRFSVS